MSYTTPQDINVLITVAGDPTPTSTSNPNILVRTERRITPSWSIGQLKTKLEPITGIPSSAQHIQHAHASGPIPLTPDTALLSAVTFAIQRNSELRVTDLRPPGARQNLVDVSGVEKYEMPVEQYEKRGDSVLAWKKRAGLGRFDRDAKSPGEMAVERREGDRRVVVERGIRVGGRCRVGREDERRGTVRFVGEIEGLGGLRESGCVWVGVQLDEPVGRNDGTVRVEVDGELQSRRVFECQEKFGVFVRPEKIEAGDWPPLDDFDEDMEEL